MANLEFGVAQATSVNGRFTRSNANNLNTNDSMVREENGVGGRHDTQGL